MQQNIIFFDIDGTILSHRNYTISESTRNAIRQARVNGHLAFINTGRTLSEIDEEVKEIGFDGYVCGCGTHITYHSSALLHTTIDLVTRQSIIRDIDKYEFDTVLEGSTAVYFNKNITNEKVKFVRKMYLSKKFRVLTLDDPGICFDKFCIWAKSPESVDAFRHQYENDFDFISRDFPDNLLLEVVPKGYSKATGIEYLLKHLDIPYENAYALGDSANDYAMLKYVKHSIGMDNSEEIIRDVVSYMTKDVDDGGVEHALRHFGMI